MIQFRQRNIRWLAILGVLTALAVAANVPVAPLLLLMLGGAGIASVIAPQNLMVGALANTVQQATSSGRISPQAKEASTRASSRGYAGQHGIVMQDIGLIVSSNGDDGLEMRRTRSISKDDDGVRPFIVLDIAPSAADRNAKLRFELIDQNGREVYIHEMQVYLRDGILNILPETHLPLMFNSQIGGNGEWDMRVSLDGDLIGIHSLTLAPSNEERAQRLGSNSPRPRRFVMPQADEDDSLPLTLEDLLRDAKNQQHR